MKKILVGIFVCCLFMASGVMLTSCGSSDRTISITFAQDSYAKAVVTVDGTEIEEQDGSWVVSNESNVRIEIYSTSYAVDFSNISLTVNGESRTFFSNSDYEALDDEDEKYAGYFLLARLDSNATIQISGLTKYYSTFTFEVPEEGFTEDEIAKLQTISINLLEDGEDFVNLYEFLTSDGDKSYTRLMDNASGIENTHNTLEIRFTYDDIYSSASTFLKIRRSDGRETTMTGCEWYGGVLYANLGTLGTEDSYTLIIDLEGLIYQTFEIEEIAENLTYSVLVDDINYGTSGELTLVKGLPEIANYDNVVVKINDLVLEKTGEDSDANKIFFAIPNCTPLSTGGEGSFVISVSGITYNQETKIISVTSDTYSYRNFSTMQIGYLLDNEVGTLGYDDDGNQITLQGSQVGLIWSYTKIYDGYRSAFELYNYNININDEILFNLEEVLSDKTNNFEITGDIEITTDDYILKATYNIETGCYDEFILIMTCNDDMAVSFTEFYFVDKTIVINHALDVTGVSYQVIDALYAEIDDEGWRALTSSEQADVQSGMAVAFKIVTDASVELDQENFAISDSRLVSSTYHTSYYDSDTQTNVLILRFEISDYYWLTETIDFILSMVVQEE